MTHFSSIREIEGKYNIHLESLAINRIGEFEHYSPSFKRTYIIDDDRTLVALALDGMEGLDVSDISEFTGLQKLSLRDIPLTSDALERLSAKLASIVSLDLSGTQVTDLSSLKSLRHLKSLYLRNCKALSLSTLNELTTLQVLDLGKNQLPSIESLESLGHIQVLRLNANKLTMWPAPLRYLTALVDLDLSQNELTSIPAEIGHLKHLVTLRLSTNKLSNLPKEIDQLRNLKELFLRQNAISAFPPALASMKHLRLLDLNGNQLTMLPAEILELVNLQKLDLSQNQLSVLPPEMSNLKKLRLLDCAANQLVSVPKTIFALNLELFSKEYFYDWDRKGFCLHNNPLESPPIEIVHKGARAVREYFQQMDVEKRSNNEIKVLLVGDGGAGKTSLVRQLVGELFQVNESATHGISIRNWTVKSGDREVLVHFWDFGGQEIMHATHQFFLSKRSLYILVIDGRKDQKVEYWLKHIESFGGQSPILVVLNKMDETPSFDVNRRFLLNKYPTIKGFFPVSCANGKGIKEFWLSLSKEIATVEILGTMWPQSWFTVKTRLEELKANYLSYRKFDKICLREGIRDRFSQDTLVDFLHDLGVVLHFHDYDLENVHVIEPKWVTHAVYKIINSAELAKSRGMLPLKQLSSLLTNKAEDSYKYSADTHRYIIALMKKFELCYEIANEELFVPDLLEVQEPDFGFDYKSSLKFVIEYDFLPRSIMPRFIVKMHSDIYQDLRWRTGVVLSNKAFEAIALVRADNEARKIFIYVTGAQRKDYLTVILYVFRGINNDFKKLTFFENIPMPDNPDVTVSYKHLLKLAVKGDKTYMPDGAEHEYDVAELLGLVQLPSDANEQIMQVLREIVGKFDNKKSLFAEVNSLIELKPNIFGIGVNINELLKKVFRQ